jgi:outer membrane usher protein FimD/PapC
MLYPALPPVPPAISIAIQSNEIVNQLFTEKQALPEQSKFIAEAASEHSGNATAAKAQNIDSLLEEKQPDYLNNQLELATQHYDILVALLQEIPPEFSNSQATSATVLLTSSLASDAVVVENQSPEAKIIANLPKDSNNNTQLLSSNSAAGAKSTSITPADATKTTNDIQQAEDTNSISVPVNTDSSSLAQNIKALGDSFLVGIIINEQEVGSLQIHLDGNTLLIPLDSFSEIAGFQVEKIDDKTRLKTPLGIVDIAESSLKKINNITYVSEALLKEKLFTKIEFDASDLALIVDLPWRPGRGQSSAQALQLKPEVTPPSGGLSSLRQEFNVYSGSGQDASLYSSTLLGGRLAGGMWRVRMNNNFENSPNISEYFFFKRAGQFRYQVGRQQIGLHPLLTGVNLTGAQVAYTNLATDRFTTNYSASQLLPRRSRPIQTFRGEAPPASFVQLRVAGIVVAQQQVGLNGEYEFIDVNLPSGQSNEIELLIFDRNNLSAPIEIRSLRINASDLLLPAGGVVQLAGVGLSGNLVQDALFNNFDSTDEGEPVAFYQFRQGLSNNLTFEGTVQTLPDRFQTQAGLVWQVADPLILATSVGTSRGEFGYTTDLDLELERLQILGNSEFFPEGYLYNNQSRDRYNHSLEVKYKFSDKFNLGFLARSQQIEKNSADYILPTFSLRPFSNLYLSGRPDYQGEYLFNAFYYPSSVTRLSFNSYGDTYITDFTQNLSRNYQISLGTEFGGDLAARYTATLNHNALSPTGLSWRLGLAYSDGEVGPVAGASMRVLPGLFARLDYQAIPSRSKNAFGGIGDDRFTLSLVSDLSFAGGRVAPADSISMGQDRGGISGRILVEGDKKDFDLGGSFVRVFNSRNQSVGGAVTDSQGNFFVGNLREGVYLVLLDPEQLPVELAVPKSTVIAEVAGSAITRLDFSARPEYGVAGRITDAAGQPMAQIQVELIGADGKRVTSEVTDESGLYRLDGVPVGKYTLQIPSQDAIAEGNNLPKRGVEIRNDFVYDQNLQLPISAAARKNEIKAKE